MDPEWERNHYANLRQTMGPVERQAWSNGRAEANLDNAAELDRLRARVAELEARAERAEAELAASLVVRAELEHRLAKWSDDKLRAANLVLTEQHERAEELARLVR